MKFIGAYKLQHPDLFLDAKKQENMKLELDFAAEWEDGW